MLRIRTIFTRPRLYFHTGCIVQDLKRTVASLELRIHKLRREAMTLVRQNNLLRQRFELLVSIPGIAQVSAMQLLAELSTLPSDLTVREWVAHSGLDPAHEISGSSVRKALASAAREIVT